MNGETNLSLLLAGMEPMLWLHPYGYAVPVDGAVPESAFAIVREDEGLTVIATMEELARLGLDAQGCWARITLKVHSDLSAVGLTAAFAKVLTAEGISANVIAGFFHDHIFVQWDRRDDALAALRRLSRLGA